MIGVFDSGYGGLTIYREIQKLLPQYDYMYFGDNARAPYGTRSFDIVYKFTWQAVQYLFERGCELVILGCNTASAKALRTIQKKDLPRVAPDKRVLGVIQPTVEALSSMSRTGNIGVLGTQGTVSSHSYDLEVRKLFPFFKVYSQACPMWVPLVENRESDSDGADYFVKKYIDQLFAQCSSIDTLILACTHYPLLIDKIRKYVPQDVNIINQGQIVARSLKSYLNRHPEIRLRLSTGSNTTFLTTENADKFQELASVFLHHDIQASHADL